MSNPKTRISTPLQYHQSELYLEDVKLASLLKRVGSPAYIYSATEMEKRYRQFDHAFSRVPHQVCYAVKANSNLEILRLFRRLGGGFDIVSGGELFRALEAGANPATIVFSGVGKTIEEIDRGLARRIRQFNVESVQELQLIEARALAQNRRQIVSLRVNPDVDPKTHPYIATGLREHKFGIDIREVAEIFRAGRAFKKVRLEGIGFHIGSQILDVKPFVDAACILADSVKQLRRAGFRLTTLDLGGGLGIPYQMQPAPTPRDLANGILPILAPLGCELVFEPGRWLVAAAGVLATSVLFTKRNGKKNFVVVDAGMNDLLRPSLYQAYHEILPTRWKSRATRIRVDVVGPICETGDFFARDRVLQAVEAGDTLVLRDAGAYGFSLASQYNSHPRCVEVMVRGRKAFTIRKRETYEDLVRGEGMRKA